MLVFSFVKRTYAEQFQARFGGELVDPATRPRWQTRTRCGDFAAEERLRNGRCINCDD